MSLISLAVVGSLAVAGVAVTPPRPDTESLTPGARRVYERLTAEEFCGCESSLTLAGCLDLKPKCRIARHLGQIAWLAADAGSSEDELLGYFALRVAGQYCAPTRDFALDDAPSKGPRDAPITIVEFADFRCSHCRAAMPLIKDVLERFGKRVRVVFVPFPLRDNPLSLAAAQAAFAAGAQGKFWQMHDLLFEHQARGFEREQLVRLARKLKLDMKRFKTALDDETHMPLVAGLKKVGVAAGVMGTPAFFVNGRRFDPDPGPMDFERRINMEIDRGVGECQ